MWDLERKKKCLATETPPVEFSIWYIGLFWKMIFFHQNEYWIACKFTDYSAYHRWKGGFFLSFIVHLMPFKPDWILMNGFCGCNDFPNCFRTNISWSMKLTFDPNTLFFASSFVFSQIDFLLFSSRRRMSFYRRTSLFLWNKKKHTGDFVFEFIFYWYFCNLN